MRLLKLSISLILLLFASFTLAGCDAYEEKGLCSYLGGCE